jgi:ABC transporter substrate binding protein/Beta-eliminating lyase
VIALLVNPNSAAAERQTRDVQEAARTKGVQLSILKASSESEIDAAFASLVELHAGALLVGAGPFFNSRREKLVALAAQFAVPAIYEWREFAELGGLISYGPSQTGLWRQVGIYVGRILKGAKPADLPVQHDAVRAGRQPQDRQGARPHRPAIDPRARRRGHRMRNSTPMTRIDLRSDTVTLPSAGMRQAMAAAPVGDEESHGARSLPPYGIGRGVKPGHGSTVAI